jgi:two-component system OmpR family response regulator
MTRNSWKTRRMSNKETAARVLLIDDDQALATMLTEFLATECIELTAAANGETGLDTLAAGSFDMVILDIMLPGERYRGQVQNW